jgi:HEAT repeat protein
MALIRSKIAAAPTGAAPPVADGEILLAELSAAASGVRRSAARSLAAHPDAAMALCDRLELETAPSVRSAIMNSLIVIDSPEVAARLAGYLRSDDTTLRNTAIEALQEMPNTVVPLLERLLNDRDSDVRIFAVNILSLLRHPEAPERLGRVIRTEPHINVCAAAVDGLAEVGGPDVVPDLQGLAARFAGNAFMRFAIETAIRRIHGA